RGVRRTAARGAKGGGRAWERIRRARARARARVLRGQPREDRGGVRPDRALRRAAVTSVRGAAPPENTDWLPSFEHALALGDPLGASDALRKSGVNGWVWRESYDRAVEAIDRMAPAPTVRLDWAERLLAHPRRVDKELAALMAAPLARSHRRELAHLAS